jgi:hypothetical protein
MRGVKVTRWEVSFGLNHKFSYVELAHWLDLFDSPRCQVGEDNGSYWLAACRFEKLDALDEVRWSARKLIKMMTAFAKIELDTDYQSVERDEDDDTVTGVREHVGQTTNVTVFGKTATVYVSANPGKIVIRDKDGNVIPQPRKERWYDFYLDRCDEEIGDTILRAIAYFARRTSWYNLHKAYELILYDIDKDSAHKAENWIIETGWVDDDKKLSHKKLSHFRLSAQYYDFLVSPKGDLDESRHSPAHFLRKFKGKQPADVMHKPEAMKLIGNLTKEWLEYKKTGK